MPHKKVYSEKEITPNTWNVTLRELIAMIPMISFLKQYYILSTGENVQPSEENV